jgi:hypothetical protein
MWWGLLRPDGCDFSTEGVKGKVIFVSPSKRRVIVRNGPELGLPSSEWVDLFYRFASDW